MEEFGHVREGEGPEITGVRLVTYVDTPSPRVARGFGAPTVMARAAGHVREPGWRLPGNPGVLGSELSPGHEVRGPAIIEETFTTIVVYPGWRAHVDDAGEELDTGQFIPVNVEVSVTRHMSSGPAGRRHRSTNARLTLVWMAPPVRPCTLAT